MTHSDWAESNFNNYNTYLIEAFHHLASLQKFRKKASFWLWESERAAGVKSGEMRDSQTAFILVLVYININREFGNMYIR